MGEQDLVAQHLPEALAFRDVSSRAGAHLKLLADNTYRTPWLAAKLLSKDKIQARDAAAPLVRHLAKTKPNIRTSFEEHLVKGDDLWRSLVEFATADPPVFLRHDDGKNESMFTFLAHRFLLANDHVPDAEKIHARWHCFCNRKNALKLRTLQTFLRLMYYAEEQHIFPDNHELSRTWRLSNWSTGWPSLPLRTMVEWLSVGGTCKFRAK